MQAAKPLLYNEDPVMNTQQKEPLENSTPGTSVVARPRRPAYVVLAVVMIALFAGMTIWHLRSTPRGKLAAGPGKNESPNAPADVVFADETQLKNLLVEPVMLREVTIDREATGKVVFNEDRLTPVFPAYSGRVVEVLANKGEVVRMGQPLLVIESPDFVAAQNDLTTARSDADKATINLKTAEVNAERARNLFAQEAISQKDLQDSQSALALAQGELQRAQAALSVGQAKLELFGKAPGDIARTKATVDRRLTIVAPISGTIVDRQVGLGQILKTDASAPLFQISDLSALWVQADVFESDLANIRLGSPVAISVESYPNRSFPARISYIDPRVDPATRTVHVRCQVNNAGGLLKPEMFAKVRITAAARQAVPVVPLGAIVAHGEKPLVLVEESPGRFRKREIVAGDEMNGSLTVKDGLKAGERIVTRGALLLN